MQNLWKDEEEFINKTCRKFRCMAFLDGVELKGKIIKFKYHQASNAESYLCLGSSCSAYFEIVYLGNETILAGKTIRLFIDINRSNGHIPPYYGMVSLGPHSITKVEKNGNTVSILAYDDLSAISGTSDEIFVSVRHFLANYIQNYYGIFIAGIYINDDFYKQIIDYKFNTSTKNMKDKELLAYTSQLFGTNVTPDNGGYGIETKKTSYCHRWYDEHYGVYKITPDRIYEFKKNGDLYSVDKLECIVEKEVNGETVKEKLKAGLGTGGISFSNPFMTQDILNKIYGFMGGLVYQPCTLKILGDPRLEVGDIVTVVDTDGKEYKVPIMAMDMEYDGGITTTITAYGGSDGMSSSSGPTAQAIEKVYVKMYEADRVVADKVTAAEGEIKKLSGDYLDFKEGEFESLKSDTAEFKSTTTESLKAVNANIENLTGDYGEFKELTTTNLTATTGKIDNLQSDHAEFKEAVVQNFSATNANITNLSGNFADFKTGEFEILKSDTANFKKITTESLNAATANIENLTGSFVEFKEGEFEALKSDTAEFKEATIENLKAVTGEFESLNTKYAEVDLANIKDGCITTAMIGTGVIETTQIADGSITDAKIVDLTANKITAGTLDAGNINVINLNCANLTVGTINGKQIADGAIDTDNIAPGAIQTEQIGEGVITTEQIASGTIKEENIALGAITASRLNLPSHILM